jgi:hypothetical protein
VSCSQSRAGALTSVEKRLSVFVGCEASGCVRRAFERLGHRVTSCDLRPAADVAANHYQMDVFKYLDGFPAGYFDIAVYHAPCTYILQSGVRWIYRGGRKANGLDPVRCAQLVEGALFFKRLHEHPAAKRCASENPEMSSYGQVIVGQGWSQHFQPHDFGVKEVKDIYLWLRGLPPLVIDPAWSVGPAPKEGDPEYGKWARVHYTSPGPDRGIERSAFYDAIADQMAIQWAGYAHATKAAA